MTQRVHILNLHKRIDLLTAENERMFQQLIALKNILINQPRKEEVK